MAESGCMKDGSFQNLEIAGGTEVKGILKATDTCFFRGYDATTPSTIVKYPAPAATLGTGALTITIAQILTGILEEDPEGAATWTLPTAALAVTGVVGVAIGDCIDFSVINNATTGANEIITVAAGANGTLVGNGLVAGPNITEDEENSGSALFRIRFTGITGNGTYSVYRIA